MTRAHSEEQGGAPMRQCVTFRCCVCKSPITSQGIFMKSTFPQAITRFWFCSLACVRIKLGTG